MSRIHSKRNTALLQGIGSDRRILAMIVRDDGCCDTGVDTGHGEAARKSA